MAKRDNQLSALTAFGLVSVLGILVAAPIVAAVFIGRWLDRVLDSGGLVLALAILAGVFSGLYSAYRVLSREVPWKR